MQFLQGSDTAHEDIIMKLFLLSLNLEDNASVRNWYEGFPHKIFSSLKQLIDAFSKDLDYDVEEHVR